MITQHLSLSNNVNWTGLVFAADCDKEPHQDVHIITAKSEYIKLAYDLAVDELNNNPTLINNPAKIDPIAANHINNGDICVCEHVSISRSGITVCINVENITDDNMWKALDMVATALDQLDDGYGEVTFGDKLTFSTTELPLFYRH